MSSSLNSINFFLSILLAISMIHAREGPSHPRFKYDVHIINGCESGIVRPISGTCRSPTREIGTFDLPHLWDEYHWSFKLNRRSQHVYRCHVARGFGQQRTFMAFDQQDDTKDNRCGRTGMCWWKITEVGIYFGNNNATWTKAYNWENSTNVIVS
ncbi:hypothetical protein JCGZ_12919 [Jatropha curcas]|uniref:Uncharacterized protein n=1 Tax=Jatropha curcas TaxID=180498 RepID=A0A067KM62_JATCU|nr:hypothetical protein JCGZ_12919 [Jatropha curcas]